MRLQYDALCVFTMNNYRFINGYLDVVSLFVQKPAISILFKMPTRFVSFLFINYELRRHAVIHLLAIRTYRMRVIYK